MLKILNRRLSKYSYRASKFIKFRIFFVDLITNVDLLSIDPDETDL